MSTMAELLEMTIEQLEAKIQLLEFQLKIAYRIKLKKYKLVQRQWRKIYNVRVKSSNFIKYHVRRAIANPNTQLCQNRLHHEFYDMV